MMHVLKLKLMNTETMKKH